jgi:hypothetical protein
VEAARFSVSEVKREAARHAWCEVLLPHNRILFGNACTMAKLAENASSVEIARQVFVGRWQWQLTGIRCASAGDRLWA